MEGCITAFLIDVFLSAVLERGYTLFHDLWIDIERCDVDKNVKFVLLYTIALPIDLQ